MSGFVATTGPSPALANETPRREFFIVGCPRSGTSLLRFMLDAHPEIAVTPETHYAERHLRNAAFDRRVDTFCASAAFARMPIDEARFRSRVESDPDDPWRPLRVAMEEFGRCRGAEIVGEKTPSHALHLESMSRAFPRARFILVLRDPRAVAASWLRTSWSTQTSIAVGEKWRRYARAMREARRTCGERCHEVRYEELVTDPEAVLAATCAFLGTRFDAGMLRFHERVMEDRDAQVPPDEGEDNPLLLGPVDPSRVSGWRAELGKAHLCRVESACGRTMTEMGYRLETSLPRRLAMSLVASPQRLRRRVRHGLRAFRSTRSMRTSLLHSK